MIVYFCKLFEHSLINHVSETLKWLNLVWRCQVSGYNRAAWLPVCVWLLMEMSWSWWTGDWWHRTQHPEYVTQARDTFHTPHDTWHLRNLQRTFRHQETENSEWKKSYWNLEHRVDLCQAKCLQVKSKRSSFIQFLNCSLVSDQIFI